MKHKITLGVMVALAAMRAPLSYPPPPEVRAEKAKVRLSKAEKKRLRKRMQRANLAAEPCSCGPGECSGPIGVRCVLTGFVVDRERP